MCDCIMCNKMKERQIELKGEISSDLYKLENLPTIPPKKEKYGGGLVDWTGLAMVHGGDNKPELMLDNIQMNRLDALLTMGERDRGGGGSNDFSTQNVDSRRITSTVTNIAAPQKHLFGVQEQRFGLA